jgi:hypothetical protein
MAAPTLTDSFWLTQSSNFKNRVQSALLTTCAAINSEATTGITGTMPNAVHSARKNFVAQILNPVQFSNWMTQFVLACSVDSATVTAATGAASLTSVATADTAAAQSGPITDTMLNNACSAVFNAFIAGI